MVLKRDGKDQCDKSSKGQSSVRLKHKFVRAYGVRSKTITSR